ncbi:MAG: hypothetical protein ACXVAX_08415 [Pseudobdellovibrio sp.]
MSKSLIILFVIGFFSFIVNADPSEDNNNIYEANCTPGLDHCKPDTIMKIMKTCGAGIELALVASDGKCYLESAAKAAKIDGKWICYRAPSVEYYNCAKKRAYDQQLTQEEIDECNNMRAATKSQGRCGE